MYVCKYVCMNVKVYLALNKWLISDCVFVTASIQPSSRSGWRQGTRSLTVLNFWILRMYISRYIVTDCIWTPSVLAKCVNYNPVQVREMLSAEPKVMVCEIFKNLLTFLFFCCAMVVSKPLLWTRAHLSRLCVIARGLYLFATWSVLWFS